MHPDAPSVAAELLRKYAHCKLHDVNEAETRLKVIDSVLFDLLGWRHDDVKVEDRIIADDKTVFCDYIFRTPADAFVVEAKKIGLSFAGFPQDAPTFTRLSRRLMATQVGAAIKQARTYAHLAGVGFAVVTNGSQWIVFPASRTDQVPLDNTYACVFPSLHSVLATDREYFVKLLSRGAVIAGSLSVELLGHYTEFLGNRRLNAFFNNRLLHTSREDLFPWIANAILSALTDDFISGAPALLQKCYVSTPERTRFDTRIKMFLSQRRPEVRRRIRGDTALRAAIETASESHRPAAILILGLVGAGKTTFLRYTRDVTAQDLFLPSGSPYPHWVYIDFIRCGLDENASAFMFKVIREHIDNDTFLSDWNRCISPAYKAEFAAMETGPLYLLRGDDQEMNRRKVQVIMDDRNHGQPYVEKIIKYVSARAPVFLVVDNVDQIPDDARQSAIFGVAMAIATRLKLSLILSMRNTTFAKHRHSSVFNAFDYDAIYIEPPLIRAVLSKRFFVAEQLVKEGASTHAPGCGEPVLDADEAAVLVNAVRGVVVGGPAGALIDVLSNSDVRLALRMTRDLLQSGQVITTRLLEMYKQNGQYSIPIHEVIDAVFIGNHTVYHEDVSLIGNPFDAMLNDKNAQLLRLFILSALVVESSVTSQPLEGMEIRECIRKIGFTDKMTLTVLEDLCRLRFAHTVADEPAAFEASFLPTRLGGYMLRDVIANFSAIGHFMMGTFIYDDAVWNELRRRMERIYQERDIIERTKCRIECVRQFFGLIKKNYSTLRQISVSHHLSASWCDDPIEHIESTFNENVRLVEVSLEGTYGERGRYKDDRFIVEN